MKMKFVCLNCGNKFKELPINKRSNSLLLEALIIYCPKCDSDNVSLTEKGKLLIERKAKINKIENGK